MRRWLRWLLKISERSLQLHMTVHLRELAFIWVTITIFFAVAVRLNARALLVEFYDAIQEFNVTDVSSLLRHTSMPSSVM